MKKKSMNGCGARYGDTGVCSGNTACTRSKPNAILYGDCEYECCAYGENLIIDDSGASCAP